MKTRSILTMAVLAASISSNVVAKSPDWNFIQLDYSQINIENLSGFSPVGLSIVGSKLLGENVFIVGSYGALNDDFDGIELDLTQALLGLGYRYDVTSTTDLYGAVSYQYIELDASFGRLSDNIDEHNIGLTAGLRSRLSNQIELDASVAYVGIDGESEAGFGVTANYFFTQNFAVGVGYALADNIRDFSISARYVF